MLAGPIERNKPIPETDPRRAPRSPVTLALRELQPGESRVMSLEGTTPLALAKAIHRALGKGCYRTAPEEGGIRVWRI